MILNIKKLNPKATMPAYSREGDAALDLTAVSVEIHPNFYEYKTGLAIEVPQGHVGLIFPRSSISNKPTAQLANSVGVIDSNYRGEICVRIRAKHLPYLIGDRIAQILIIPIPYIQVQEINNLSSTVRGDQGFGSSGN